MGRTDEVFLFLVVLGGKVNNANVEIHDVRWVVGSTIEDTFRVLRRDWFGTIDGLHIDSFKKINCIDGYKINLINVENCQIKEKNFKREEENKNKLWFVNLGGYERESMQERHEFGLVVAKNSIKAKKIAKSKWLFGCRKKHIDNLSCLKKISDVDDCKVIKNIDNWEIELTLMNDFHEENNHPDWFGYMRIDNIVGN